MTGIPGRKRAGFERNPHGCVRIWEKPVPGEKYTVFADIAEGGVEQDASCAYVLRNGEVRVVANLYSVGQDTDELAANLYLLGEYYQWALIGVEVNRKPDVIRRLRYEHHYKRLYYQSDLTNKGKKRLGWTTHRQSRPVMLDSLRKVTRLRILECFDAGFAEEMGDFVQNPKTGKWGAAYGRHDDRIMSMAGLIVIAGSDIDRIIRTGSKVEAIDPFEARRRRIALEQRRENFRSNFTSALSGKTEGGGEVFG